MKRDLACCKGVGVSLVAFFIVCKDFGESLVYVHITPKQGAFACK
jgi:hypothetical protein